MKVQNKLIFSAAIAIILLLLSLFFSFIPCQTAPIVPNPQYTWKLCTLNPDSVNLPGIQKIYFGYATQLSTTYAIILISGFILGMLVLSLLPSRKKK
jgi:hypothetical protein